MRCPITGFLLLLACCGRPASADVEGRGSIEVPEMDLAPTVPARVLDVRVDEGAVVREGDTLVVLTQSDLPAVLSADRARLAQSEANLKDLEAGARPEELARARAELATAQAEAIRADSDLTRIRTLAQRQVVSRQQLDQAQAAARTTEGRRDAAQQALRLLEAGPRAGQITAARAQVANQRAALHAREALAGDLVLTAPRPGVVLSRNVEPGEVLGAGIPALTVGEISRPYVRIYLPQKVLGRVRPGQPADITLEGDPSTHYRGRVEAINPKAEFTPRVALTEQERADLLFGVKVAIEPDSVPARPGLWVRVRLAPERAAP
jgi:membrane fusion protein YbhG